MTGLAHGAQLTVGGNCYIDSTTGNNGTSTGKKASLILALLPVVVTIIPIVLAIMPVVPKHILLNNSDSNGSNRQQK